MWPVRSLCCFFSIPLHRQLQKQPNWKDSFASDAEAATGKQQWKLYVMFGLMCGKLGVWNLLNGKLPCDRFSLSVLSRAFKAILAGTCIASFTPNRVGEYLGRMLFVDPGNKITSIAPTILCSMSQMLVTLICRIVGYLSVFIFTIPFRGGNWLSPAFIQIRHYYNRIGAAFGWPWFISDLIRW